MGVRTDTALAGFTYRRLCLRFLHAFILRPFLYLIFSHSSVRPSSTSMLPWIYIFSCLGTVIFKAKSLIAFEWKIPFFVSSFLPRWIHKSRADNVFVFLNWANISSLFYINIGNEIFEGLLFIIYLLLNNFQFNWNWTIFQNCSLCLSKFK